MLKLLYRYKCPICKTSLEAHLAECLDETTFIVPPSTLFQVSLYVIRFILSNDEMNLKFFKLNPFSVRFESSVYSHPNNLKSQQEFKIRTQLKQNLVRKD